MATDRSTIFDDILDLALARDVARRPTLVRVLVDGFVRDDAPRSTREIKQAEELLLHLLPQVDAFTRAVAAQKLAERADAPRAVIERLAIDDPEVAEPILAHSPLVDEAMIERLLVGAPATVRAILARRNDLSPRHRAVLARHRTEERTAPSVAPAPATPEAKRERRPPRPPTFLEAPPTMRRALLAKLSATTIDVRIGPPPENAARTLVRLAVLRQRESLLTTLAQMLGLPLPFTRRLLDDPEGEPLVVAAKVLDLTEDVMAQLLALSHPDLGDSTDKILELRLLQRSITREAAATVVATWRSEARDAATAHQPVQAPTSRTPIPVAVARAPFSAPLRKQGGTD